MQYRIDLDCFAMRSVRQLFTTIQSNFPRIEDGKLLYVTEEPRYCSVPHIITNNPTIVALPYASVVATKGFE